MKLENRTTEDVRNMFCDSGLSDYLVMYARFLTSGFLQKNAEKYEPFIQEFPSVERFVRVEVRLKSVWNLDLISGRWNRWVARLIIYSAWH